MLCRPLLYNMCAVSKINLHWSTWQHSPCSQSRILPEGKKAGFFKCPAIDVAMPLQSVRGALESTTTASEWIPGMGSFQTKDPATGGFEHALQKGF